MRTLVLPLLLSGCATAPVWPPIDLKVLPKADRYEGADAVALETRNEVRFALEEGKPVAYQTFYLRVLILKERGQGWANGRRYYSKTFDRVVDASARLTLPDGTATVKTRGEMVDALALSHGTLYQDDRVISVTFDHIPVGSVAEHRFTVKRLQPELFAFDELFGESIPTELAELVIETPPGFAIEHAVTEGWRTLRWDPEIQGGPSGSTRATWRQRDLAAIERDEHGPGIADRARIVLTRLTEWRDAEQKTQRSFADLAAFGRWIHEIQGEAASPTPQIRKLAAEILAGAPAEPRERAKRLYSWVQSNVRYVSVQVGIGGWAAHAASDVLVNKYGDCKDKATILRSLLRAADIPSRMVILHAHDGIPRPQIFPVIGVVNNHAIVAVDLPGGTVFADPTTRTTPFGQLPPSDQGASLLVVSAERGEVIAAPIEPPGSDRVELRGAFQLDAEGRARGTFVVSARGAAADRLESASVGNHLTHQRTIEGLGGIGGGEIEQITFQRSADSYDASGKIEVPEVVAGRGRIKLLHLDHLITLPTPDLPDKTRTSSIVLGSARQKSWTLDFELPPGLSAHPPPPLSVESAIGEHAITWTAQGQKLSVMVSYRVKERVYHPRDYAALRDFFEAVDVATATPVVLEP